MSYQHYLDHITAYEREFKTWEGRVEKIIKRYRDDKRRGDGAKFNVLWSNVQTLKAATFSRMPMPDVSRRFRDNDPVGRVAALLLERALQFEVEHNPDFGASLRQCIYDRFLGGRGSAWVRYEPTFMVSEDAETEGQEEDIQELESECTKVDYVHWKDFGHAVSRTWEECTLVWRKVYLTEKQAEKRFKGENLPLDTTPDEQKNLRSSEGDSSVNKRALVYEMWDKETGEAIWLSRSVGKILDTKPDPLGLEQFFPCSPPLYSTLTTDTLVPIPDFTLYQDQANELDTLSDRIAGLVKMLQLKGVYDAAQPELKRLFTEGQSGDLLPVENWASFAEKKGLAGAIDLVETLPIAQTLSEAYGAFEQVKSQIYEITGISDILRGETKVETATAQKIKNSYASLRLKVYQDEVERFATRLLGLKAQIMCRHFDPQTLLKYGGASQLSEADKPFIEPAIQLLKSGVESDFRIEVETDSMIYLDEQQEKSDRMEFLQATGQMLDTMMKITQEAPILAPVAGDMLKFGVTGFRVGKTMEGTIDQVVEQLKQEAIKAAQQPKPNPEMVKAQAAQAVAQTKAQGDMQVASAQAQADMQKMQLQAQVDQAIEQSKAQATVAIAQAQSDSEQRTEALRLQHEAALEQLKAQNAKDLELARLEAEDRWKKLEAETKVVVAQIAAQASAVSAQASADATVQSAEKSADATVKSAKAKTEPAVDLAPLQKTIDALAEQINAPVSIVRDDKGKAQGFQRGKVVKPIQRDANGRATGV